MHTGHLQVPRSQFSWRYDSRSKHCGSRRQIGKISTVWRHLTLVLDPQEECPAVSTAPVQQPSPTISLSLKPLWTLYSIQVSLPLSLTEARSSEASGSPFSTVQGPRMNLIKFSSLDQIKRSHRLSTPTHSEGSLSGTQLSGWSHAVEDSIPGPCDPCTPVLGHIPWASPLCWPGLSPS